MPCTLCQAENPHLQPIEASCNDCGSFPEDRAFTRFFREFVKPEPGVRVLDVAPPAPMLANFYRFLEGGRYTAIAPVRLPEADRVQPPNRVLEMSVTHLSFSDSSFDIIICNHVLTYVRSDFLAMSELHRCLKSQGMAFLNVSMAPGKSRRAGEGTGLPGSGREWRYGEDYFERLEAAGLFVLKIPYRPLLAGTLDVAGLPEDALQIVCFKFRDAMERFQARLPA